MNLILEEPKSSFDELVEKMIQISKEKPLLPEKFIPWNDDPDENTHFLPVKLISLHGHALWHNLTKRQQIELGRLEVVQVMYSYAWSETLSCHFFNRHLLSLDPNTQEYRFLIRESIEEYRHQEMFGMAISKLQRNPILPSGISRFLAHTTVKFLPSSLVFLSVLSVEMMADIYAKHIRKDPTVYSVLRKLSELHHIEEGRHIFYTKHLLKKYTENTGFIKASFYSVFVLANIAFMKSLYIQKRFFNDIGVNDPMQYYKIAKKNNNRKFAELALEEIVKFVESFNGMNWLTKPIWKWILKII